jgi:hypothetical protein
VGHSAARAGRASFRGWRGASLLAAVAVAAVLAVRGFSSARPAARDRGLSVLLVSIDTLRADALGC